MDAAELYRILKSSAYQRHIWVNEPMRRHTTFRIGGPADILVQPQNLDEIGLIKQVCFQHKIPVTIIGNGSNLLVLDGGIRGVVMKIGSGFSSIEVKGETARAEAGASLAAVCAFANKKGLSGMEFACGIPGTVGGAVVMNAGAYGGEMKDIVNGVAIMDISGCVHSMDNTALQFGYRSSILQQRPGDVILEVSFALKPGGDKRERELMKEYMQQRKEKQPIQYPSAGSFFRRPAGYYAAALIEKSGLKGSRIGDAQVSDLHAGFVINRGRAKARDVVQLMEHIQTRVLETSGVKLEPEVRIIGEDA